MARFKKSLLFLIPVILLFFIFGCSSNVPKDLLKPLNINVFVNVSKSASPDFSKYDEAIKKIIASLRENSDSASFSAFDNKNFSEILDLKTSQVNANKLTKFLASKLTVDSKNSGTRHEAVFTYVIENKSTICDDKKKNLILVLSDGFNEYRGDKLKVDSKIFEKFHDFIKSTDDNNLFAFVFLDPSTKGVYKKYFADLGKKIVIETDNKVVENDVSNQITNILNLARNADDKSEELDDSFRSVKSEGGLK